jgi:hypothetical protein
MKYLLILTLLFTGCYSAKKAAEQVKKANDNYPEVVAKTARDLYPCTDLLKPDTVLAIKDSLIYIECPELVKNDYISTTDTIIVRDSIYRIVKVPVKVQVQTKYITSYYEDSAKLKLLTIQVNGLQQDTTALKSNIIKLQGKVSNKNKELWIWRILAVLIIAGLWAKRKINKKVK